MASNPAGQLSDQSDIPANSAVSEVVINCVVSKDNLWRWCGLKINTRPSRCACRNVECTSIRVCSGCVLSLRSMAARGGGGGGKYFLPGNVPLDGDAFSRELLEWDSSSYLRLSNVPECLYCRWKVKCSSFNLKNGQFIKIESDLAGIVKMKKKTDSTKPKADALSYFKNPLRKLRYKRSYV